MGLCTSQLYKFPEPQCDSCSHGKLSPVQSNRPDIVTSTSVLGSRCRVPILSAEQNTVICIQGEKIEMDGYRRMYSRKTRKVERENCIEDLVISATNSPRESHILYMSPRAWSHRQNPKIPPRAHQNGPDTIRYQVKPIHALPSDWRGIDSSRFLIYISPS